MRRRYRWPRLLTGDGKGIAYGGDYNPDQWPERIWTEDIQLMKQAHVNVVALGIFSWDRIQPTEYEWDFIWLDRIISMLGDAGISVDLATGTASAPLWLYEQYPEVLPRDRYGHVIHPGSRQSWSPSSSIFRHFSLQLCKKLAKRYGHIDTVTAWHVGNEYGWNNRHDYSDDALRNFRKWCQRKYGTIDQLNEAWCTSFWSQEAQSFDEILLPKHMGSDAMSNPAQVLDFERFGNDMLLDFFTAERDVIGQICPDTPISTNFMISTDQCSMDYAQWAQNVDFVANDHYFHEGESHLDELLCSDALVSSLAQGNPWYLMEHSTSAVQWKSVNVRKRHGELLRDALVHVAMGSDAINFFQWRQSRGGAEAFHSAMIPHAGTDTGIFREVCDTGKKLDDLSKAGVDGTKVVPSQVVILFDAPSQWATTIPTLPTTQLDHWHDVLDWYRAFLDAGYRADVMPLSYDWNRYDMVILPTVFMLSDTDVQRLSDFVFNGGKIVVGYGTGIVNEHFQVGLGGYPGVGNGVLRKMLGIYGEEFNIIGSVQGEPDHVVLSNGWKSSLWQTCVTKVSDDTQVVATYTGKEAQSWDIDGLPAITKHMYGKGIAWYIGCDLPRSAYTKFITDNMLHDVGMQVHNPDIVTVERRNEHYCCQFRMNRSSHQVTTTINDDESVLLAHRCEHRGGKVIMEPNSVVITMK